MALISERVSSYPIVGGTCKAAAGAYNWVKETSCVGPLVQTAEDTATFLIKPIVGSTLGQKIDELAVHGILDPVEAICAYVKDTSSDRIISPAVNLAEACANLCLPEDQNPEALTKDATNYDRIMRLKYRTSAQALRVVHLSVDTAQSLLSSISKTAPVITIKETMIKVTTLCELAQSAAKAVSIPIVLGLINTVLEHLRKINNYLQESKALNWIDFTRLVMGLEQLKDILEKPESQEALELNALHPRRGLARDSDFSNDPVPNEQSTSSR